MNENEFKDWLLEKLRDGPIKATEIAVELGRDKRKVSMDFRLTMKAVDELVLQKKIIEVEYTNPNTDFRRKSIYFHGEAQIKVSGSIDLV